LAVILIIGPLGGTDTLLTAPLCVGAGMAAAYVGTPSHMLARGAWLLAGAVVGGLGFALAALMLPDTKMGTFFGGAIPVVILALATMWTKRQSDFLIASLGAGATTGVYAHVFFADPQGLNYSLPIALGQTILPLGLGFVAAIVVQQFVATDDEKAVSDGAQALADDSTSVADDVEMNR
jgi:hypothetical protein